MSPAKRPSSSWADAALDALGPGPSWGYRPGNRPAAEPTALAALALAAHGRSGPARTAALWLADARSRDGSLGPRAGEPTPGWPTAAAVLACTVIAPAFDREDERRRVDQVIAEGVEWLLRIKGRAEPRVPFLEHDTTLVGWPWVDGTHSWLEPTAWALLALRAAGRGSHSRAREAVRLLVDRMLPSGGCNYGNTRVFGTELRPQVGPTGLALWALAGENEARTDRRLKASLDYLRNAIDGRCPPISLALALLGLAAHDASPADSADQLARVAERERRGEGRALHLALLALADPMIRPLSGTPHGAPTP